MCCKFIHTMQLVIIYSKDVYCIGVQQSRLCLMCLLGCMYHCFTCDELQHYEEIVSR